MSVFQHTQTKQKKILLWTDFQTAFYIMTFFETHLENQSADFGSLQQSNYCKNSFSIKKNKKLPIVLLRSAINNKINMILHLLRSGLIFQV